MEIGRFYLIENGLSFNHKVYLFQFDPKLNVRIKGQKKVTYNFKWEQAGAELCQAHIKLG